MNRKQYILPAAVTASHYQASTAMIFFRKMFPFCLTMLITMGMIVGCAHNSWGQAGSGEQYYYFIKSNVYKLNQQNQDALVSMLVASELEPNSAYLKLEAAKLYFRAGNTEKSLELTLEATKLDPKYPAPLLFAGWLEASKSNWEAATAYYKQVLNFDPKNEDALTNLGVLYSETKQPAKAEATFKRLLTASPGHLPHYYLGRFYSDSNRKKEAIRSYKKAVSKKPDFIAAHIELALLYEEAKNYKKAEQTHRAILKLEPELESSRNQLARLLVKSGKKAEAEKVMREVADEKQIKAQIGLFYLEEKRFKEALKEFEELLAIDQNHSSARYLLASTWLEMNKVDKAREQLMLITPDSNLYVDARLVLASNTQGENDAARLAKSYEIITETLKIKPDHPRLKLALAMLTEQSGDLKKARKILVDLAKEFTDSSKIQFHLGVVEDQLGNKEAAIAALRKAIELDPNFAEALNYLAYTWADKKENLPEALAMAHQADKLKPGEGYIIDTIGWIYFHMGDTTKALKLLKQAAPLSGQDPVVLDHLGDAYVRLGQTKKALEVYRKALEQGFADQEILHEKIRQLEK